MISFRQIRAWAETYPDAKSALVRWYSIAEDSEWNDIQQVRANFPTADAGVVKSGRVVTVFNIRGNNYRLITAIHYNMQRVYILKFLTHNDYDTDSWKGEL
jgi:mRNA interferase HigB